MGASTVRRPDRGRCSFATSRVPPGRLLGRGATRLLVLLGLTWAWLLPGAVAQPVVDAALWQRAGVIAISPPVPLPDVALRDLQGKSVRLRDFRDQVALLYFWTTW